MKIEFCDLKRQYGFLKEKIDGRIANVLEHGRFINGPEVEELEKRCSEYVGTDYAVGVGSGTTALLISLVCFGVGKGDYVITTPFTFISTAEVISFLGAVPVFVDIDEKTYNIDAEKIKEFLDNPIDKRTGQEIPHEKIKGIIAVDLFGQCADYEELEKICEENNLFLIEDGAQSFGAEQGGKKACCFGDISTTSFFPSKPLGGYGDGGMIFTNNKEIAEKAKAIRNHGQEKKYCHKLVGMNSRLDSIQAAVLLAKLDFIKEEIEKRNWVAEKYFEKLKDIKGIRVPFIKEKNKSAFAQFSIQVEERDKLKDFLGECEIPNAIHYPIPLHMQEAFFNLNYKEGDFVISEKLSEKIISLPMDAYKREEEIDFICDKIKEFENDKKVSELNGTKDSNN